MSSEVGTNDTVSLVREEGSECDSPSLKLKTLVEQEDTKTTTTTSSTKLESFSQTSLNDDMEVLTNGIGKGGLNFESGTAILNDGKVSVMDAPEKRDKLFSRQNSDRGAGGEGQTGERKQETEDMEVSFYLPLSSSLSLPVPILSSLSLSHSL